MWFVAANVQVGEWERAGLSTSHSVTVASVIVGTATMKFGVAGVKLPIGGWVKVGAE